MPSKTKKPLFLVLALVLAAVVVTVSLLDRTFVLRLPAPMVERVVFRNLDVGDATTEAEVRSRFDMRKISRQEFWSDSSRPFPSGLEQASFYKAHLGTYRGLPFRVDVVGVFAFDPRGRLVFAEVRKQYDAL